MIPKRLVDKLVSVDKPTPSGKMPFTMGILQRNSEGGFDVVDDLTGNVLCSFSAEEVYVPNPFSHVIRFYEGVNHA